MLRSFCLLCGSALLVAGAVSGARAESEFVLAYPAAFGRVDAVTYDDGGKRIGGADLVIERLDSGRVRLRSESGEQSGARNTASAELTPVESGLQVLVEQSRSLDERGHPLGVLTVDHVKRTARCQDASGEVVSQLELPAADRVLNVPMNLFFLPLVSGEVSSLEFQLFMCRPEARLIDFVAWAADGDAARAIEVRYGPDLGIASSLARHVVPRLSFWFGREAPYPWVAHRVPLYSGGPEVFVVRGDVSNTSLLD